MDELTPDFARDPLAPYLELRGDRRSDSVRGDAIRTDPVRTDPVRTVFAAAHVVLKASYESLGHSLDRPGHADEIAEHIDWDATMAIRRHLDAHGFGVAEAMDTAQRFFLGWPSAQRLIQDCGSLRLRHGFIAGAGVDHLSTIPTRGAYVDGVLHQIETIQRAGGYAILLPHPWLVEQGYDEDDYVETYRAIIGDAAGPLTVHWLGSMFHSGLAGYFPGDSFRRIMALDPEKVRGCKLSLLDAAFEHRIRSELLPRDQVVFTGDDFNFGGLILGGDPSALPAEVPAVERHTTFGSRPLALGDFSHGLLGIFDAIARPAGVALDLLALGERDAYHAIMARCETLGQLVFEAPTQHYKAGLAFLAWLDGHQPNAMLVNREERSRSVAHYRAVVDLALRAGVFGDRASAEQRFQEFFSGR